MIQAKFSLTESQLEFLEHHESFGFRDKSSVVRAALERLRREYEERQLEDSAELYAEIYETDPELQKLTEQALEGWPV